MKPNQLTIAIRALQKLDLAKQERACTIARARTIALIDKKRATNRDLFARIARHEALRGRQRVGTIRMGKAAGRAEN